MFEILFIESYPNKVVWLVKRLSYIYIYYYKIYFNLKNNVLYILNNKVEFKSLKIILDYFLNIKIKEIVCNKPIWK